MPASLTAKIVTTLGLERTADIPAELGAEKTGALVVGGWLASASSPGAQGSRLRRRAPWWWVSGLPAPAVLVHRGAGLSVGRADAV
jgi:hypothetical protein